MDEITPWQNNNYIWHPCNIEGSTSPGSYPSEYPKRIRKCWHNPLNKNVFADDVFLPSYVTDRPIDTRLKHDQKDDQLEVQSNFQPSLEQDDQHDVHHNNQPNIQLHVDHVSHVEQDTTNDKKKNPMPGQSGVSLPTGISRNPEMLCPLKCPPSPGKTNRGDRKKCQTSILTSTPEKQRLLDEVEAKKSRTKPAMKSVIAEKKVLPNPSIGKGKGQDTGKKRSIKPEVDWKCIICSDWYSNSLPGEEWAQCIDCEDWAHSDCTDGRDAVMCELCQQKMHSDFD